MKTAVLKVLLVQNEKCGVVFRSSVLVLFFLRAFFVFCLFFRALQRCRSLAKTFSILAKRGRRLKELSFFSAMITDSILLKDSNSAFYSRSTGVDLFSEVQITVGTLGNRITSTIFIFALISIQIFIIIPLMMTIFSIKDFTAFVRWNAVNNFI